jgi:hypothetical protein
LRALPSADTWSFPPRPETHHVLREKHRDFTYQPLAEPEEVGNSGRVRWAEGRPGEAPEIAGTDFIIARDGKIAAVYLFFDKLK